MLNGGHNGPRSPLCHEDLLTMRLEEESRFVGKDDPSPVPCLVLVAPLEAESLVPLSETWLRGGELAPDVE